MTTVKEFYTVAELALATGYSKQHVRRLIRGSGIAFLGGGSGSKILVPLSEIVEKLGVVFFSQKLAESQRKYAAAATGDNDEE